MTRRKFQGAKRTDKPATKPSARVERATEAELRLETLLRKLDAWLRQQPDWVFLLSQDRRTRRTVGAAVADLLTRIPQRQAPSGLAPGQVLDVPNAPPRLPNEKNLRSELADAYMDELERQEESAPGAASPSEVAPSAVASDPEPAPTDEHWLGHDIGGEG